MKLEKEIRWIGSAYDDLLTFPDDARRTCRISTEQGSAGLEPEDWRHLTVWEPEDIAEARYRAVIHMRRDEK